MTSLAAVAVLRSAGRRSAACRPPARCRGGARDADLRGRRAAHRRTARATLRASAARARSCSPARPASTRRSGFTGPAAARAPGWTRPRSAPGATPTRSSIATSRETSAASFGRGPAVRIDWTDGQRRGVNAFVRQPDVLDALSVHLLPARGRAARGRPLCFDLVGGRKAWRVSGSVGPVERVETRAGTFTAVRIDGRATRTDRPGETTRLQLWVSADARRLPVKATMETAAGTVRALLASVVIRGRRAMRSRPFVRGYLAHLAVPGPEIFTRSGSVQWYVPHRT